MELDLELDLWWSRETVNGLARKRGPAAAVAARSRGMRELMTSILFYVVFLLLLLLSRLLKKDLVLWKIDFFLLLLSTKLDGFVENFFSC